MLEFNPDAEIGASLATRWRTLITDFEMYLLASGITDVTHKRALLLYQSGSQVREIFNQLPPLVTEVHEEPTDEYKTAKAQLAACFEPQKNRRYEVYRFRQTTQAGSETLNQYHTQLRTIDQTCEFQDVDFEIEEQIIIGGSSSRNRKWALRNPTYNLAAILLDGRRDESSTYQARKIEERNHSLQKQISFNRRRETPENHVEIVVEIIPIRVHAQQKENSAENALKTITSQLCRGRPAKAEKPSHPLSGNTKRSKKKHIRPIQHETGNDSSSDLDDYLYSIQADKSSPKVNVEMLGHKFKMTIDTGATINVRDRKTFQKLKNVTLRNTNPRAYAESNKTPVDFLGKFETVIETKRRYTVGVFYIVNEYDSGCLLSSQTEQELSLMSLHLNKSKSAPNAVNKTIKDAKLSKLLSKHKEVFNGLGKLKDHKVVLQLQPYDFTVVYKSGTENSADYMSRHPAKSSTRKQERVMEAYINFVARNAVPKAMTLAEIQQATNNDQTMKGLHIKVSPKILIAQ